MTCLRAAKIDTKINAKIGERYTHISSRHPCFSGEANVNRGRIHLPVSPACNIQCRFCKRVFNKAAPPRESAPRESAPEESAQRESGGAAGWEQRPGVSARLLRPEEAPDLVRRALELCPEITVAGIAGPGDTLATGHALETFAVIHREFPRLINCLSTNGLLLERYADDLFRVGVRTVTVTVNAVDPLILDKICSQVIVDGKTYKGPEGAAILIEAQKRGIRRAAALEILIKINIVFVPSINGDHIGDIARTAAECGAGIVNIIPLIPQYEFAGFPAPDCVELARARTAAENYLPVFRHCQHCRADAVGVPGREDLSSLFYGRREFAETFSHG
ncbi:MAG: radical SAM protein [Treponema sp.]|jgi:nitrogen fixation protein NifB|nr:radical SAM protein [Treponema sp.]